MSPPALPRRHFLKAVGITLGLPLLESLTHRSVYAPMIGAYTVAAEPKAGVAQATNLVCIGNLLGFYHMPIPLSQVFWI